MVDVRRHVLVAAVTFPLVLLAACGTSGPKATLPPVPRNTTTSSVPTAPSTTARSTTTTLAPLTTTTPTIGSATVPLVRTSQVSGISLDVPQGWVYTTESYPSDHATYLWRSPTTPSARIEIIASGCAGCVEHLSAATLTNHTPNPLGVVPKGATDVTVVSACVVTYALPSGSVTDSLKTQATSTRFDSFPDSGKVIVHYRSTRPSGYVKLDVWLPSSESSVAAEILSSYQTTSPTTYVC